MRSRIAITAGVFLLAAQPLSAAPLAGSDANPAPAATDLKPHVTSPLKPIKWVNPKPPPSIRNALSNVRVCFTVKADGSVSDARVKTIHPILNTSAKIPPSLELQKEFGKSALDAIRKWQFSPRMINGKAVATPDVCQLFEFHSGGAGPAPILSVGGGPIH